MITLNVSDSIGSFIAWLAAWSAEWELLLERGRITAAVASRNK